MKTRLEGEELNMGEDKEHVGQSSIFKHDLFLFMDRKKH